ncbi:MAG TPA: type II toxin-antitoxin system HicA family toxin [Polyangia bacterium]
MPQVTGARLVRALERAGFIVLRQSGSHVTLRHSIDLARRATVPVHGSKAVKPGTLRAISRAPVSKLSNSKICFKISTFCGESGRESHAALCRRAARPTAETASAVGPHRRATSTNRRSITAASAGSKPTLT